MTRRVLLATVIAVAALAGCRNDGREMRPPVYPAPTPTTTLPEAPLGTG